MIVPSTISAAEILQRALSARGGEKTAADIRSFQGKGTVDIGMGCLPASPTEYLALRPNRFRFVTDIVLPADSDLGQYDNGFDGRTGWNASPGLSRVLQGQEYELRKDGAAFFAWYDEPRNYQTVECLGEAQFDGKSCYDLKVVTKTHHEEFHYYDTNNFLLAGVFSHPETQGGSSWGKTTFTNYRAFDGFLMPTHIVWQDETGSYLLQFDSVEINTVKERDLQMAAKVEQFRP